jgi:succinate dehydrogenase hydrophobic anchor subunit
MPGEKTQPTDPGGIRFGAMLVGMLLCLLISMGLPYGEFVIQGTRLGLSSSTPAAFFLLFVLVAFVHPLLGLLRRSWAFTQAELLLVRITWDGQWGWTAFLR